MFSPGSKDRLTEYDLGRFPGDTLFHRIGRGVCRAGCLPRKELYEAWEVARRVRRHVRGGRIVDMAAGHGLLAHVMLLLDDSSPNAIALDPNLPLSAASLHDVLVLEWPRLADRITFVAAEIESIPLAPTDVVVSSHACGALTDRILEHAAAARACVAVLPCCHDVETCDAGALTGWMDAPLAIDVMRAIRLEQRGYRVRTQSIPAEITPKNRLLIGDRGSGSALRVNEPPDLSPHAQAVRATGEVARVDRVAAQVLDGRKTRGPQSFDQRGGIEESGEGLARGGDASRDRVERQRAYEP